MSKSLALVKSVGKFFGIAETQSDDWQTKPERQIREGEFGLSLKRSISKHDGDQEKFVSSAHKMLSHISTFQKQEESQKQLEQIGTAVQPVAGTSRRNISQDLTLLTPKSTPLLEKQWTYNKTYTESDKVETNLDSGNKEPNASKTKVKFEIQKGSEVSKGLAINKVDLSESNIVEIDDIDSTPVDVKVDKTKAKSDKPKIIFFDEVITKPLHKPGFSDSDMYKSKLYPSVSNTRNMDGNVDNMKYKEYSLVKEIIEKGRSSPEINIDLHGGFANIYAPGQSVADTTEQVNCEEKMTGVSDKTEATITNEDDSQTDGKKLHEVLEPEDVVYGKDALKHYKFYLKIEKSVEKRRLKAEMEKKLWEYDWKLAAIDEMILLAKDYYVNPNTKNATKWRTLKQQVKKSSSHQIGHTNIRRKLGLLPVYRPYFTYFIILAQLLSFIVVCAKKGITDIGLEPRLKVESGIQTFIGIETVHKWTPPNIWIGPSQNDLIGVGAVFSPCMRDDIQIQLEQSRRNYSMDTPLGCCEVASRNVAGTTTLAECAKLTDDVGTWQGDINCDRRPVMEAGVRHNMKPCCLGVRGQCRLLSHKHCLFLGGTFYQFGPTHCSQVMCLENICKPGRLIVSKMLPWQPDSPSQWWRVPLSLLYHHGILELVIVLSLQWILIGQIEWVAGWLRVFLIYTLSGTMSLLTSAIFLPYESNMGGVGAVCGMGGVILVELIHFWKIVQRPYIELLKLLSLFTVMLFLGTLPYLDIFGMITGFIVGALSAVILLPYVTFGKWQMKVRLTLVAVASIVLFLVCYFLLQLFINVQSVENCETCKVMNCIPYTEAMCNSALWQQF